MRRLIPIIVLALSLPACGLLPGASSTPVDRSQDQRIQQEVTLRLANEPSLGPGTIRVEVQAGIVLLNGSVRGMGAWQCALTNGGLVSGVRSVVDYLVIERGPRDATCLAPRPNEAVITGR